MRIISFIVTVVLILLVGIGVYLGFQNRNSAALRSKVIPGLAIAVVGALFAIWFSLKSENIEREFISTLFFNKSDKRPLDYHLRGDGRLKFGGGQFGGTLSLFISNYLEKCGDLNKAEFNKDTEKIVEFYHNLILIKLIDQFFWMYSARWDTNVYSVRRGTGELKESYVGSKETPPNYDCLKWEDLLNTEQQNNFYDLLSAFSDIKETKVPPKTKVDFIITERKREMILKNPFVKVTITINNTGGSLGLGDYKWLLGYDNKKSEEFWSAHFRVNCNAKFEKLKSGHPEMPKYKRWVEVMFAEVQYLLDEKEQLKRANEYRDLIKP